MDIRTLSILLGIANVLQVMALLLQYRVNKTYRGLGWWVLGFASIAMGFILLLLRDVVSIKLITIILGNSLTVSGMIFLYIGIMQFLDTKVNLGIFISIFAVFILPFFYYTYVNDDIGIRTVVASAALAANSFLIAQALFVSKTRAISASANFVSAVFLANGCFFGFRAVAVLTISPVNAYFTPTLLQVAAFLQPLIAGILLAYGLIIMVNQRLVVESREAQEHFELIFNTSPDATLITRLHDGLIIDVNDGFTALTGFTRADAIGKSSLEINVWKNPADRHNLVNELGEKGFCENMEAIFQRKDGRSIFGSTSAKIFTLQGQPHIISVTRDITERARSEAERRQAQEALSQSEERYRTVADYTYDWEYWLAPDGKMIYTSPSCERITGYRAEEFITNPNLLDAIVHPDDSHLFEQHKLSAGLDEHQGNVHQVDLRIIRQDGQVRWIGHTCQIIRRADGTNLGQRVANRDITERQQAEEKLRESEKQLAMITDHIPAYVARVDSEGYYRFVNRAYETLYGKPRAELIDQHASQILGEAYYIQAQARIQAVLLGQPVFFETPFALGDKRLFLSVAYIPDTDEQGLIRGYFVLAHDITERKQAELALQQAHDTLEQKVAKRTAELTRANQELERVNDALARQVAQNAQLLDQVERDAQQLEQRVTERTRELATLYDMTTLMNESLDLQVMLDSTLERTLDAVDSSAGALHLLDEDGQTLRLVAQRGLGLGRAQTAPLDEAVWSRVARSDQTLVIADLHADPHAARGDYPPFASAYVGVPIQVKGKNLGVLSVFADTLHKVSANVIALLAALADRMGAAVENAHLRRQAEQVAVLEERQRLARDLHDSLTQTLYGLVMLAEAGGEQIDRAAHAEARPTLARIEAELRQAIQEMRLFIHELRPSVLEQDGLIGALHLRLAAVEGRSNVKARLLADDTLRLSPAVEQALYRIAQEALNNTLRHARASTVTVYLSREGRQAVLQVLDDGVGFDLQDLGAGGLGLTSMRERAEQIGGSLKLTSQPGQGTRVKVTVPEMSVAQERLA